MALRSQLKRQTYPWLVFLAILAIPLGASLMLAVPLDEIRTAIGTEDWRSVGGTNEAPYFTFFLALTLLTVGFVTVGVKTQRYVAAVARRRHAPAETDDGDVVARIEHLPLWAALTLVALLSAITVFGALWMDVLLLPLASAAVAALYYVGTLFGIAPGAAHSKTDRARQALWVIPLTAATAVLLLWLYKYVPLMLLALAVIVALTSGFFLLRRRANRAIGRAVSGEPSQPEIEEHPAPAPSLAESYETTPAVAEVPQQPRTPLPFALRVIRLDKLPEASENSRKLVAAVRERGRATGRLYRHAVLFLALPTSALWLVHDGAVWLVLLLVPTLWMVWKDRRGNLAGSVMSLLSNLIPPRFPLDQSDRPSPRDVRPIRPLAIPLLGGLWLFATATTAPFLVDAQPYGWALASIALALPPLSIGGVFWRRARLRARYPVPDSLRLLALRVFGSPYLTEFFDLTRLWTWIGTRRHLDGHDTAGRKLSDLVNLVKGRLEDSIIEDTEELETALADMGALRDRQLRYKARSLQCNDKTWQMALDRLHEKSDVVVMDLCGFSQENRGCVYEIGLLFDRTSFDQVMFLIDERTDLASLEDALQEIWARPSATSPNRVFEGPLELYMAVTAEGDERIALAMGDSTVEAICDKALGDAPPTWEEPQPKWVHSALPAGLETAALVLYGFYLVTMVLMTTSI